MREEELERHFFTYVGKMTPAQRAAAYAAGEEVDHIPFSILGNEQAMAHIFGYTTAQWRDDPAVLVDVIARRREEFGIEGIAAGLRLRTTAEALGATMHYPEVGIDRVVAPAIGSIGELGRIVDVDPRKSPVYQATLERGRLLKDAFPDMALGTTVAGPFTVAATTMPPEQLLRDLRRHPDEVRELLDLAVRHALAWAQMFADEFGGAGCTVSDPMSCANVLGKKAYREFSLPAQEKLVDGLTRILGRAPGLHVCGKTNPLWDDMATLRVSSFSVDDCEDLRAARERLGDRFALSGNVAPVDVMLEGDVDDVIAACRECIRQGAESPKGYKLGTGCQVPIGTPRRNVMAFVYAARTYGAGARKGCMPRGMGR